MPCYVNVKRRGTGGAFRMHRRWIEAALIAGLAIATAGPLSAQQPRLAPAQPSIMDEDEDTVPAAPPLQPAKPARGRGQTPAPALEPDPDLDARDQLAPSQVKQPMPAAVSEPSGGGRVRAATRGTDVNTEPAASAKPSRLANPHVVACSGLFGPELEPPQAGDGLSRQERRLCAGRCRVRREGNGVRPVCEGSETAS